MDDEVQTENSKACIADRAEIISKRHAIDREKYAERDFDLLHAANFSLNLIQKTVKDVFACTYFLRERTIGSSERDRFQRMVDINRKNNNERDMQLYKMLAVEMLVNQTKRDESSACLWLRTRPMKRVEHPMKKAYFSMLYSRASRRVLHHYSQKECLNDDKKVFTNVFVRFVQNYYNKTASLLKRSAVVIQLVHAVLLKFSNACKWWLVKMKHSKATLLPAARATEK